MISSIKKLGLDIENEWKKHHYHSSYFADIAVDYLTSYLSNEEIQYTDIVDWVFCNAHANDQQPMSQFGQPPVTLFSGKCQRFHIIAYFWFHATPSIHEHGFSGAFAHIYGSSLHSQFSFEQEKPLGDHLRCGHLKLDSLEVIPAKKVQKISLGKSFIHHLFHLETPSVTLAVRTLMEEEASPYFTYNFPGIATQNSSGTQIRNEDPLLVRQMLLLEGMIKSNLPKIDEYIEKLLNDRDVTGVYKILEFFFMRHLNQEKMSYLYSAAVKQHGPLIESFMSSFYEQRRSYKIVEMRKMFYSSHHRLFLGLLLVMRDRKSIFDFLKNYYPQEVPEELIVKWLKEMTQESSFGIDFDEVTTIMFRHLIKGFQPNDILKELKKEYQLNDVKQNESLLEHCKKILKFDLFKPLMNGDQGNKAKEMFVH